MALFRCYRNNVNQEVKTLKKMYSSQRLGNLCSNSNRWWSDVGEITYRAKSRPGLQGLANSLCNGNIKDLAGKINNFLQWVTEDFVLISDLDHFTIGNDNRVPHNFIIRVDDYERKMVSINVKKATGPDSILRWILKDGASLLAPPGCAAFNSSLWEGFVPTT